MSERVKRHEYRDGAERAMNITLFGYYGFRNLGDDLMLEGILNALTEAPAVKRINVLVQENHYSYLEHPKVVFYEARGLMRKLRRVRLLFTTDCAIWGGGTCLFEGNENGVKNLKRLYRNVWAFRLFRCPFMWWGVGIGEIYTLKGRNLIARTLSNSALAIFREKESYFQAISLLGQVDMFHLGGDLVFLMADRMQKMGKRGQERTTIRSIGFSGMGRFKDDGDAVRIYASILESLIRAMDVRICFLPMQRGLNSDNDFHGQIAKSLPRGTYEFLEYDSPEEAIRLMGNLDFLIGMRLHSIILADLLLIPNIAVVYASKVAAYVRKSGFLVDCRLARFGEPISSSRVQQVASRHALESQYLLACIDRERKDAWSSLEILYEAFHIQPTRFRKGSDL